MHASTVEHHLYFPTHTFSGVCLWHFCIIIHLLHVIPTRFPPDMLQIVAVLHGLRSYVYLKHSFQTWNATRPSKCFKGVWFWHWCERNTRLPSRYLLSHKWSINFLGTELHALHLFYYLAAPFHPYCNRTFRLCFAPTFIFCVLSSGKHSGVVQLHRTSVWCTVCVARAPSHHYPE